MKKHIQTAMLSLLSFLSMNTISQAADEDVVRVVNIPAEEHGYSNFETMVIRSQAELDQFLKKVNSQSGWNEPTKFTEAITKTKLNFEKELLVLIRRDEGSGSVQVTFHKPSIEGKKVICILERQVPEIGTADMAYYCYALAVTRESATAVEIQVKGAAVVTVKF